MKTCPLSHVGIVCVCEHMVHTCRPETSLQELILSSHHVPGFQGPDSGCQTWNNYLQSHHTEPAFKIIITPSGISMPNFLLSTRYYGILNHKGKYPKLARKLSSALLFFASLLYFPSKKQFAQQFSQTATIPGSSTL